MNTLSRTRKLIVSMALIAIVGLLAISGCVPEDRITTDPDAVGTITEINQISNLDVIGQILVESHADNPGEKYMVTVTEDTFILDTEDENIRLSFNELALQQQLELWFDGPVRESFPMQATASQILVVRRP